MDAPRRLRRGRAGLAVTLLLAAGGCATLPLDADYAGPLPRPAGVRAAFAHEPGPFDVEVEIRETTARYAVHRVQFDALVDRLGPRRITMDYYDLPGDAPGPVILVLPISGGGNEVARHFAKVFARRGWAACIVHRQEQYKDLDQLEEMNAAFEQIVFDHRQAIDWLVSRPDTDPARIGLFGVSAGAIKGALVCGVEPRISAAVLGLAGGDVPYIFAYSRERGIAKRRRRILEESGIDQAELYRVLAEGFEHDPLRYAPFADARRTLLILARFDAAVPYEAGRRLRAAMGGPRTLVLPTGHFGAILFVPCIEHAAASFFREQWSLR